MIELLQNPAVTMAAAAVGGWAMKLIALNKERQQEERLHTLDAFMVGMSEGNKSANAASKRSSDVWGKLTKRVIAWTLVMGFLALCFAPGIFEAPAIVESVNTSKGFLWGLIGGGTKTEFHELNGFVHSPALLAAVGHIVAFYFGQGAAKP